MTHLATELRQQVDALDDHAEMRNGHDDTFQGEGGAQTPVGQPKSHRPDAIFDQANGGDGVEPVPRFVAAQANKGNHKKESKEWTIGNENPEERRGRAQAILAHQEMRAIPVNGADDKADQIQDHDRPGKVAAL